jgi:cytoskeletal protein RodZ
MKRCPKCNSLFNDEEHFCELDGTPLISEPHDAAPVLTESRPGPHRSAASRSVLPAVAVGGVLLGVLLFLVYLVMTREKQTENSNQSVSNSSVAQEQIPSRSLQPRPVEIASPSVEPSPSPSPSVEPSPSPQSTPQRIELSSSPVSTAGVKGKTGPVLIRLQNGVTIEAEEAWQTGEGIWYRKSTVVSLLDPKQVKAIEKVPPPTPQPTPSPSPSP